jgi:hypothetical protein
MTYLNAPDISTSETHVFVTHSDDDGQTWSLPVRVDDDTTNHSHFFSALVVDQTTGNAGVAWYDGRNDPQNLNVEIFASESLDGGVTFLPNVQVAGGSSEAFNNLNNGNQFGDYIGLDFVGGVLRPAWADNSSSLRGNVDMMQDPTSLAIVRTFDIATAPVTLAFPPAPSGIVLPDDQFEPNDTPDTATMLGNLVIPETFANLTINQHANGFFDNDWFRLTAGQKGTFTASIDYASPTGGDLNMRVFTISPQLTLVQLGASRLRGVTHQQVSISVTSGEPLFVWIYGFNHAQALYTLSVNIG